MATLEKVSTLDDMKALMGELHKLRIKFVYDFYAVLQDFSSKKILPQWLQKKGVNEVIIKENGNEVLSKIVASKRHAIIVYDIETPDLNGLQFLIALDKTPEIKSLCKVIISTPRLPPESQDKLMTLGAKALISRPLQENDFRVAFSKVGLDY